MADALSRKEVIAYITAFSEVISDFNEKIKLAVEQDAAYGKLKQQVKEGVIRRYWLEGDLFVAKGGRWYVPAGGLITTKKCYFVDLIIMVLSTFE